MKCRSVAGIWPDTPPAHRVTAAAVLDQPPTLYTGAVDGSIIWWNFSGDGYKKEIKPIAMLCGHAAPIADLGICYPLLGSADGTADYTRDLAANCTASNCGALVSACGDGVLCVWSRGSGHCRRRRKLPPWVGSPSIVQVLPENRRFVCIACCSTDIANANDHDYTDSIKEFDSLGDHESLYRKPPKCTLVIVDTYTLAIVQTVFHGNLLIGPLKHMSIVEQVDDRWKQVALMVDSHGKLQMVPLQKDSSLDGEAVNKLHDSSLSRTVTCENGSHEGGLVLSVSISGHIVGVVYKPCSVFMLVGSGAVIGRISYENSVLCQEADSYVLGGMFLSSGDTNPFKSREEYDGVALKFAVWNNNGYAIVYKLSYMGKHFESEALCEIPAVSYPINVRLSINFVQLNSYLLRVELVCLHEEEPPLWRPHISIWSVHHQHSELRNLGQQCKFLGDGDFAVDWIESLSDGIKTTVSEYASCTMTASEETNVAGRGNDGLPKDDSRSAVLQKGRVVSSSMVITQNSHVPYAVVYGYNSGEIELVRFDMFVKEMESNGEKPNLEMEPHASRQCFSGHSSAVLCLAAHQMADTSVDRPFSRVLLSGGMDCTCRIWNIETGDTIMVMHHHVAPVHQIILPPLQIDRPWNDTFLSVGEDCCVVLVSLETLRVERMFTGHPSYPSKVIWDGGRGYLACLSQSNSVASGSKDVLFIWDIKAGSKERVLRGTAAHSLFTSFCNATTIGCISEIVSNHNTSSSSLLLPPIDDGVSVQSHLEKHKGPITFAESNLARLGIFTSNASKGKLERLNPANHDKLPIRCTCPLSGIAILSFDLASVVSPTIMADDGDKQQTKGRAEPFAKTTESRGANASSGSPVQGHTADSTDSQEWVNAVGLRLLRFTLSFLHFWDVDFDLDSILMHEMKLKRPDTFIVAPGLEGDRGSVTLAFPAFSSTLQLWKSSAEFSAMRSLTMLSLAQWMVRLSHSCSVASSVLSAFYTRNFADNFPVKPPSLQLLVSFWQDEDEHVRMAARSLFHCAASRAIPAPLYCPKTADEAQLVNVTDALARTEPKYANNKATATSYRHPESSPKVRRGSQDEANEILRWLESYELQDWISCVGGTSQDAMTSHIIVAAALAIWYPSLVKSCLPELVIHPLIKLIMAMNEKYSSTAAELLAEGMDSTWKECIGSEIPRLIGDIFFQIECVSGASSNSSVAGATVPPKIRETLVAVLLPSLAWADIPGFLAVIEGLIWSTASDSPVHLVSLKTLIRVVRGSPRNLAQYLNKAVSFILQTMDPSNSVMRKTCFQSSMAALKEVVRVYPMVDMNDKSTRLAVGDAIAEHNNASIHVYDMQSGMKIKVLDASGPPGLPSLLAGASDSVITAVSALSFSPDGEGLVAFSEHGLIIRWWSLGSAWWEKLSRNLVPVQCTKLILVPPWEGFSPNSFRASIMAKITGNDRPASPQEHLRSPNDVDSLNLLIHNLDLSYRLEWVGERKVLLTRQGQELGTFLL